MKGKFKTIDDAYYSATELALHGKETIHSKVETLEKIVSQLVDICKTQDKNINELTDYCIELEKKLLDQGINISNINDRTTGLQTFGGADFVPGSRINKLGRS